MEEHQKTPEEEYLTKLWEFKNHRFKCPNCDEFFRYRTNMINHRKKVHPHIINAEKTQL